MEPYDGVTPNYHYKKDRSMTYITWDKNLLINIKEIDEQHKNLIGLINDFHKQLLMGKGRESIQITIAHLVKYTVEHFSMEEKFMLDHKYPGYDHQKKEHEMFLPKLREFHKKYKENRPLVAREMLIFLGEWYRGHIVHIDKKIGEFIEKEDSNKQ